MTDQYLTLQDLINDTPNLSVSELNECLRRYLYEGRFGTKAVLSRSARHIVVAELYAASTSRTKEKLETAFAAILEGFEPSEPPRENEVEYVFHLLSLAATIRNAQAKERLRRWLYINAFEGWQHGPFSLHGQLVLASGAYDSDEQWLHWIKTVLPRRDGFVTSALPAYRVILQTRGLECVSLVPDIVLVTELSDIGFVRSFNYLLGLTIERAGANAFCNEVIAVLNRMNRPVREVFTIILRFRSIIEKELETAPAELERMKGNLRDLWDGSLKAWSKMDVQDAYETLDRTIDAAGPERYQVLPSHFRAVGVIEVVVFNSEYYLPITKQHAALIDMCGPFFEVASTAAAG